MPHCAVLCVSLCAVLCRASVAGAVSWYLSAPSTPLRARDSAQVRSIAAHILSSPVAVESCGAGLLLACASYALCRRAACRLSSLLRLSSASPRLLSAPLAALSVYASGCVAAHSLHATAHSVSAALPASSVEEEEALRALSAHWPFTRPGQLHTSHCSLHTDTGSDSGSSHRPTQPLTG